MRITTVDLTTGAVGTELLTDAERRRDVGGGLLGTRLLLERTPPGLDPLDPDAPLIFATSVLTGRDAVGLARCAVVAKSPATGGIGEARVEGTFPVALARSGTDVLVVRGRAARASIIVVAPEGVRVEPTGLWEWGTIAATDALVGRFGPAASVAVIGPAGERGVRFASIVTDRTHPAARTGLGAVAGAKHLKAVVVLPGAHPQAADPVSLHHITASYAARIEGNPQTAEQKGLPGSGAWPVSGGLPGYVSALNATTAMLPIITVQGRPATAEDATHRVTGVAACPGCPLDCVKTFANDLDHRAAGLDEESLAAFAYGLGLTDLDTLLTLVASTRDWGVDPVSLSSAVGFAAECAARGASVTGPRFGDEASLLTALRGVALREPGWEWLGEGVARAAAMVEPRFRDAALHVKGLETVTWDVRSSAGQALATAVSPIGPRYEIVEHDLDFDPVDGPPHGVEQLSQLGPWSWSPMEQLDAERVERTAFLLDLWSGLDALGLCLLAGPPVRELDLAGCAGLACAVTGWDVTGAEILGWGRRRLDLMRQYNRREGLGPETDRLPDRFHEVPLETGRFAGKSIDRAAFTRAVEYYHELVAAGTTSTTPTGEAP